MARSEFGSTLSRRSFFMGAAGVAAAVAGASALTACGKAPDVTPADGPAANDTPSFMVAPDPIDESAVTKSIDTEVLVIGAGIGGSVVAYRAAENGLNVTLIDKLEQPRYIGIDFGFVNSKATRKLGIPDVDVYTATRDHIMKSGHRCNGGLVHRYFSCCSEAADWFIDKAAEWGFDTRIMNYQGHSDFYPNYVPIVRFIDDSYTEEDFYSVMRTFLGNFAKEIQDKGGSFINKCTAKQLAVADDGTVTGAYCELEDGSIVKINASKGTVLATGDYAGNPEMFDYYSEWKAEDLDWNESTGLGEGHQMGLWIGAQMQRAPHPMMLFHDAHVYHYLRVNNLGKRYVNEDSGYEGACVSQILQPDHQSWGVLDSKWPDEVPAAIPYAGGMGFDQEWRLWGEPWKKEVEDEIVAYEKDAGYWVESDTLEGLADQMGLSAEAKVEFVKTVERYNELVEKGFDEDFGKRPELLKLSAITEPPFIAKRMPTDLGVSTGGLMIDVDSRILDNDGNPIPGLFGVGTVTGGLFGVDYNEMTNPGISLARNVTFGKLLGDYLAK